MSYEPDHGGHQAHDHDAAFAPASSRADGRHAHRSSGPPPLLKSLVLLGLGIYFGHLWIGGDLHNYVNARYTWLPILAAVLFFVLAGDGIAAALRSGGRHARHGEGWGDHVHLAPSWTVLAIVAVPLLLGVLVPSQPLGAQAVDGDRALDPGTFERAQIPATDSLQWTVLDWLRAGSAGGPPERIDGKEADLIGFVYRREGDPQDAFVVMRFLMVHCAADAYAVGMPVKWAQAEALPIDGWVRVRGTVTLGTFRGQTLPILTAASVDDTIERPKQAYLFK
jgi:uncharacterized repeat protein (TIGR03943 family)